MQLIWLKFSCVILLKKIKIKIKKERGGLWKEERKKGGGGVRALMLDTLMLLTGLSFEVYMYDSYFRNGEWWLMTTTFVRNVKWYSDACSDIHFENF